MLVGAISRNEGAQSYEFLQVSELLECLMVSARSLGRGRASRGWTRHPPQTAALTRGTSGRDGPAGLLEHGQAPHRFSHLKAHPRPSRDSLPTVTLSWPRTATTQLMWLRPGKASTIRSADTDLACTTSYYGFGPRRTCGIVEETHK